MFQRAARNAAKYYSDSASPATPRNGAANTSFCHSLPPPYQNTETCWFHAILVCIGFSQMLGTLAIHKVYGRDSRWKNLRSLDPLLSWLETLKFVQDITYKNSQPLSNLMIEQYEMNPPEMILEALHAYNSKLFPIDTRKRFYARPGQELQYLINLLNVLGIDRIQVRDHLWVNALSPLMGEHQPLKKKEKIPDCDVLIVRSFSEGVHPKIDSNRFTLDCCILANYDAAKTMIMEQRGHEIAGITCRGKKFVFNGWMRTDSDKPEACGLWEYDWVLNPQSCFWLNPKHTTCTFKGPGAKPARGGFCFNFNRGYRLLVYVANRSFHNSLSDLYSVELKPAV